MKPLSAIEESQALSEWAMARCWFCMRLANWYESCGVEHLDRWRSDVDALVRSLSRSGRMRMVRR